MMAKKERQILKQIDRENVKWCHTDGFISDKLLDVKTGDKMGDLVFEGKCDNCTIHHINYVEGEFN